MKDLSAPDALVDDLAALLDAALADPARAAAAKATVRTRLARADSVATDPHGDAEAEDLWDNVPL